LRGAASSARPPRPLHAPRSRPQPVAREVSAPGVRRMTAELRDLSDEHLLERYNDGDVAAFEQLLSRHQRPVFNFLLRSTRNVAAAEELLQEVFLRVIQRASEFRSQSKFTTWLYTIARNQCIDHSRKMKFRRHASLD